MNVCSCIPWVNVSIFRRAWSVDRSRSVHSRTSWIWEIFRNWPGIRMEINLIAFEVVPEEKVLIFVNTKPVNFILEKKSESKKRKNLKTIQQILTNDEAFSNYLKFQVYYFVEFLTGNTCDRYTLFFIPRNWTRDNL